MNAEEFRRKPIKGDPTKKFYAFRDNVADIFLSMDSKRNDAEAIRELDVIVNKEGNRVSQFPEDYDLYYLGEFNERTGVFISELKKVANAKDFLKPKENNND